MVQFGGDPFGLVAQMVKNPPIMQETRVQSLGWKDPLEEGMTTHSSILAWRIPVDRGAWRATVHGVAKSWTLSSVQSLSRVRLLATPWTAAYQASPSMGFSRQEYWSGVPLPSPNQYFSPLEIQIKGLRNSDSYTFCTFLFSHPVECTKY